MRGYIAYLLLMCLLCRVCCIYGSISGCPTFLVRAQKITASYVRVKYVSIYDEQ